MIHVSYMLLVLYTSLSPSPPNEVLYTRISPNLCEVLQRQLRKQPEMARSRRAGAWKPDSVAS